jgi:hypothetical protein
MMKPHPLASICKSGAIKLVLSWTNAGFTLQSAPFVIGPFTNLPAATIPYTNPLTAPQQFFRLIGNSRHGRYCASHVPASFASLTNAFFQGKERV